MKTFLLVSLLGLADTVKAIELTPENWDDETAGKTIFVKFLAPWQGHCKQMKPDWDQLMDAFNDSPTQLVADVDCTSDGKPLCDSHGIRRFPTIKYGDPSDLHDYEGGRDYDSLKQFADDNLRPVCSPTNIDLCDDDTKTKIETYQAMPSNELDLKIAAEEKKLEDAEEEFKDQVEKLQHAYEKLSYEKDEEMKAVNDGGLGLMKSCKVAKIKADAKAKAKANVVGGGDEL